MVLKWSILNVNVDRIISPRHGVQGVAVLWSAVCALGNRRWLHSELAVINKMQGDCMQLRVHNNIQLIKVTTLDSRVLKHDSICNLYNPELTAYPPQQQ